MASIYKKLLVHGIKGSSNILRNKVSVIRKKNRIKSGRYNFNAHRELLKSTSDKLLLYAENYKINREVYFKSNDMPNPVSSSNFFLMGKEYSFKDNINWQFNSNDCSKSYPGIFSDDIKLMDYRTYGDYRITWELNRHHHFVWLAQKYFLTSENLFKNEFQSQLGDWIWKNNVGYGINFVSPMEISIRLINWIISVLIFSKASTGGIINTEPFIDSLIGQLLYLNDNLFIKNRKLRNNHSIVELAGLILMQSILNWNKIPSVQKMYNMLFKELQIQFYKDGINFEHSPTYARFTIESLLVLLIFVKQKEIEEQNRVLFNLVKKYLLALRKFVNPQNTVPLFSDCDNGRILFLGGTHKDFNDFRGFFDFCALFFNEDSLFLSEPSEEFNEETKWWCFLANAEIRSSALRKEPKEINFFSEGGYYICKTGSLYFAFKSGYPGNRNLKTEYAPHVHNDLLSFELFLDKKPLLVDSGTYTYNFHDDDFRNYFRSVYAHNTIIVNGHNHFKFQDAFGATSFPEVKIFKKNENGIVGELFFKDNLYIKREVSVLENKIEFFDLVTGLDRESKVEINLNFHPSAEIFKVDEFNKTVEINNVDKYIIKVKAHNGNNFEMKKEKGWVSGFYNCKETNEKLIFLFSKIRNSIAINWYIKKN